MSEFLSQYEDEPQLPQPNHEWRDRFTATGALIGAIAGVTLFLVSGDISNALAAPSIVDKMNGVSTDLIVGVILGGVGGGALGHLAGLATEQIRERFQPRIQGT